MKIPRLSISLGLKDITGMKFGRWTAIRYVGNVLSNRATWFCKCDCGTERNVISKVLISGRSKSCICLQKELTSDANRNKSVIRQRIGHVCSICKILKPNSEYNLRYGTSNDKYHSNAYKGVCKSCENLDSRIRKYDKKYPGLGFKEFERVKLRKALRALERINND